MMLHGLHLYSAKKAVRNRSIHDHCHTAVERLQKELSELTSLKCRAQRGNQ